MGLLRSKRTFGQANAQEPARKRARTARASSGSNSLLPTNGDSLRRSEDQDDDVVPYDGTSNSPAPDPATPDEEAPKSIGPFLGKLPQEIRDTIYEYVIDFDNVPMAHFSDGVSHWTRAQWYVLGHGVCAVDEHEDPPEAADLSILSVSKVIHKHALAAFYRTQTINLNRLQCRLIFKRKVLEQPEAFPGDLKQVRHLLLRIHWSGYWASPYRDHNIIDLDSFFTRMRSKFPLLRSVTMFTDNTEHGNTSLFEVGSDLMNCDRVTKVTFDAVDSLVAETVCGFIIRVKHLWVIRRWQEGMATPLAPMEAGRPTTLSPSYPLLSCVLRSQTLSTVPVSWPPSLYDSKRILDGARTNTLDEKWHNCLQEEILRIDLKLQEFCDSIPKAYKACGRDSNEFWTWAAGGHIRFIADSSHLDSEKEDTSEIEDGPNAGWAQSR
jgi:hypothetical protein